MFGFLLTCVASIHTAGWAMDRVLTAPLYHMPELAVWVLRPLLFPHVAIIICVLNKSVPSPGKRGGRGGFMNLCPSWPIIGCSPIWEAEAKLCPCTALLTCGESGVPGKASGHPGKIVAGSRIQHQPQSPALYPLPSYQQRGKKGPRAREIVLLSA